MAYGTAENEQGPTLSDSMALDRMQPKDGPGQTVDDVLAPANAAAKDLGRKSESAPSSPETGFDAAASTGVEKTHTHRAEVRLLFGGFALGAVAAVGAGASVVFDSDGGRIAALFAVAAAVSLSLVALARLRR